MRIERGTPGGGQTYYIQGYVTSGGSALSGVTMTLGGAANKTATTDSGGAFSFTGLADGAYTITPSRAGCSFIPTSRGATISGADVIGQDFTGKCKY